MKIYVCDYRIPRTEEISSFLIEADNDEQAQLKAIQKLKSLKIPKRYIIKLEVF